MGEFRTAIHPSSVEGSTGLPDHELAIQHDAARPPGMRAVHAIKQQLRRLLANLVDRLGHCRQTRAERIRPGEIVKAGDRDVPRAVHAKFSKRSHEAKNRLVVDSQNSGRRRRSRKELERRLARTVVREAPQLDE